VKLRASVQLPPATTVEINKAVITAAGQQQAALPLQSLVDRDGVEKTALQILLEEIRQAGIENVCVVIRPGDAEAYRKAAGGWSRHIELVEQARPLGYGHAVWCAHPFIANSPFLLMVSDHLYVSHGDQGCAQELVGLATTEQCAVSAVQATHESKLPYYGAAGGRRISGHRGLYQIEHLLEKPTPTEAEQRLIVPGLRAGTYLCFFGLHVLTPTVIDLLGEAVAQANDTSRIQLTDALNLLATRERYLAAELQGRRYDIGVKYGLLNAQLAIALDGRDRDEVLTGLVELLAARGR
jgi:UTP--glucose-1-phosphate uridylyltransferase